MNIKDELIGTFINEFEIIGRDFEKEAIQKLKGYNQIYYICKCSCGNIKSILKGNLISGKQKSCGCKRKTPSNFDDLTNKFFDNLRVIERDLSKKVCGKTYWICQCKCGNIVSVEAGKLKSGHTKSCGCLQKEKAHSTHFKDLSNMDFGFLHVIDRSDKVGHGQTYWNCECVCGKKTVVAGGKLVSGQTRSCGCKRSKRTKK